MPGMCCLFFSPLKNVSTWRGIFEPSTVTFFTERERVLKRDSTSPASRIAITRKDESAPAVGKQPGLVRRMYENPNKRIIVCRS